MQIFAFLSYIVLAILFANPSFAQVACVNDPDGSRGIAQNQGINNALLMAHDPLTKAYLASLGKNGCLPVDNSKKTAADLSKVTNNVLAISKIKPECIKASLQREVGSTGYTCPKGKPVPFDNSKDGAACINEKTFGFIQFAVNQAISCMSPPEDPIDPRFILKKINNETGFNFYLGYIGGVGIGQLTSDPVNEIAGWTETTKFKNGRVRYTYNQGNAHYILDNLMTSTNPACAPFKKVIEKELKEPPPAPGSRKNYCSWVSVGDGVARSLVYGLGYYIYARDHFIKDTLKDRNAEQLMKNKELVNTLTLVAYGPGGPVQAKTLIKILRLNNNTNPVKAIQQISNSSNYVDQTNTKMSELLQKLNRPKPATANDLRGDLCVSH